jgi:hypothetical protein
VQVTGGGGRNELENEEIEEKKNKKFNTFYCKGNHYFTLGTERNLLLLGRYFTFTVGTLCRFSPSTRPF